MQKGVAFSRTATLADAACLTQGRTAALGTSSAHDEGGCGRPLRAEHVDTAARASRKACYITAWPFRAHSGRSLTDTIGEMQVEDRRLKERLSKELDELENEGEVVLFSAASGFISTRLAKAVLAVVPHSELTFSEMAGLRSLVLHAISDKRFFDWEMPTLTGFSAEEFRQIAEKLPRE